MAFFKKKAAEKEEPAKQEEAPAETAATAETAAPEPEKAQEKPKNGAYFVSPHPDGGWQVKKANAQKALKRFKTKAEAERGGGRSPCSASFVSVCHWNVTTSLSRTSFQRRMVS